MLSLVENFQLLKGFPIAKFSIVKDGKDLYNISFPYYMKLSSENPELSHKTEKNIVLYCKTEKEAIANFKILNKMVNGQGDKILIQEQIQGVEMIIGIKSDKAFGKLLMLGFGGTTVETLNDISFRAIPVSEDEIEKMIKELILFPTLTKRKEYPIKELISLAKKVSDFAEKNYFREIDLNPIILTEDKALIVDARMN